MRLVGHTRRAGPLFRPVFRRLRADGFPTEYRHVNAIELRDLTTLHDFARVVSLEKEIWRLADGEDAVPLNILAVSVTRGAILVGAFDRAELVGFVYSFPGVRRGRLTQWSHMLGVLPAYRSGGLGLRLKLAQRDRALGMGIDLVEWTYDPLLAVNAHLNFVKLGVVVEEYEENVYGASVSPLHGELPTDRFVAQWWVGSSDVARRLASHTARDRPSIVHGAPPVNALVHSGRWWACGEPDLTLHEARLTVQIPTGFEEMLAGDAALARNWRERTRAIFEHYFARNYRAVDFVLDREGRAGRYVLERGSRE